ncbi:MAG: hypothetical protein HYZ37_09740 [Candidatus Solibacter usitatus]|nr:hypothetical protein [Candidatus Solibacter usitatus]
MSALILNEGLPDREIDGPVMLDDGKSGDGAAGDGVYGFSLLRAANAVPGPRTVFGNTPPASLQSARRCAMVSKSIQGGEHGFHSPICTCSRGRLYGALRAI